MEVEGRGADGKQYRVEVSPEDLVGDVRRKLEEAAGVRVRRVRFGDRYLRDEEGCSDVGLVAECVVDFETGLSVDEVEEYKEKLLRRIHISSFPLEARDDKEVVLESLRVSYNALKYASEKLRGDKEVVLLAVRQDDALQYASEELRGDKEVVLQAVRRKADSLRYASEELRGDKEVVLLAVGQNGYSLRYASEDLRADKEVVLLAVAQTGPSLQFASEELRGDKEVVLLAVGKKRYALQYASEELRADKEVVLLAAFQNRGGRGV